MKCKIGIVDDHQLFLKSLSILIDKFENFETTVEALNGQALLQKLALQVELPEILLIDLNMPVMNGIQTASEVNARYPHIRLVALSMKDDDLSMINMFRAGCCSYLLKDIHPNELERALGEVRQAGFYNPDYSNSKYRRLLKTAFGTGSGKLSAREVEFVKLASSEKTYKEIASDMHVSERTVDGYRESVFEKLEVQSRVGMVLEALRRNIITLD